RSGVDQLDGITDRQGSAAHHVRIERDAAAEAAVDALQDLDVLLEGVGIEGRHDAALAEVADPDDRRTRAQRPAFPLPFRETQHAADDDVRPQAAAMAPSVATRSGRMSKRSTPPDRTSRASSPAAASTA